MVLSMQFIVYLVYPHLMCQWFGTNTNPEPSNIYEVWLKRNGTDVTDCATRLIIGNQHFHSVV